MVAISALHYRGDVGLLGDQYKRVAVVGSRRMTEYGRMVIEKIIPGLVGAGVIIVSGFMYGVDQEAHKVCLENGGKTIAVFGWGIDWPVPDEDVALYKSILTTGLLVSEYDGTRVPALWMFPQRNRVVAALSDAVLVVEAAEKSGSLITARLALEGNKKLFCIPGAITSRVSVGTNDLIKSGAATMVTSARDILEALGVKPHPDLLFVKEREGGEKNFSEKALLEILENEGLLLDEIVRKIHKPIDVISPLISLMELKGMVKNINGRYYLA